MVLEAITAGLTAASIYLLAQNKNISGINRMLDKENEQLKLKASDSEELCSALEGMLKKCQKDLADSNSRLIVADELRNQSAEKYKKFIMDLEVENNLLQKNVRQAQEEAEQALSEKAKMQTSIINLKETRQRVLDTLEKRDVQLTKATKDLQNTKEQYKNAVSYIETLKKNQDDLQRNIELTYKAELTDGPIGFEVHDIGDGFYKVVARFDSDLDTVCIKRFDTDDADYNRGLAQELKEKLEEEI